jgi:hypothetical protein
MNVALKEGSMAIRGMPLSTIVQMIQHPKKIHHFYIVKSQHVYLINDEGKVSSSRKILLLADKIISYSYDNSLDWGYPVQSRGIVIFGSRR